MKILCAEYNPDKDIAIIPVGDDVLLRNNDDFYIPDFTTRISCVPQLVVRLCKLGKSVSEKFAGRYYEEIGVGIRFYADSFEEELRAKGLPAGMASSFGGCAAISRLLPKSDCGDAEYTMSVNGTPVFQSSLSAQPAGIERLISLASDFHTLKIGDFLYCGNLFRYTELKINDRIQVCFNGQELMNFNIK